MISSTIKTAETKTGRAVPVWLNTGELQWLVIGGGDNAYHQLHLLLSSGENLSVTVVAPDLSPKIREFNIPETRIAILEREHQSTDFANVHLVIIATEDRFKNERIKGEASLQKVLVYLPDALHLSDFYFSENGLPVMSSAADKTIGGKKPGFSFISEDQNWKRIATRLIIAFALMVVGHLVISYLPLPSLSEVWTGIRPYLNFQFSFFILAGFLAQMVDGVLGMGYGVTSATCLMSFGVSPVSVSAAIHTSEIFTTGISGYSHYKFGNVNKKLFKNLVIPGVTGAVLGAVALVYLGEKSGRWLMPVMAVYALFLGIKILVKAFQDTPKNTKVKRVGWLAWIGGFLDSFGGGGWGPIVTSTLISKGKSPRYTVGTVSLTEFFVTLASAFTFFLTVGISHWNVVLGLLIGGALAAPIAARLAGKLPRKTMMIAVGVMVIIWCIRMIIKSIS